MAKSVTRIKDAKIKFISLVPKGANRMGVLLKGESLGTEILISKMTPKGELIACVYAPEMIDSQKDWATAEDIREMAHGFMKSGADLDVMHDGHPIKKEDAYVAESFLIQKGDPRFADLKDNEGKPVDATGGWGVVIKLLREDLKKLYTDGGWAGLSMGGFGSRLPEQPPVKKEDAVTKEEIEAIAKAAALAAVEAVTKAQKAAEKPADATQAPVFKGDVTDLKAVREWRKKLERDNLSKGVDFNDPESVAVYEEKLVKFAEDQKIEKGSGQPPATGKAPTGDSHDEQLAKGMERGSKIAKTLNTERKIA